MGDFYGVSIFHAGHDHQSANKRDIGHEIQAAYAMPEGEKGSRSYWIRLNGRTRRHWTVILLKLPHLVHE